MRPVKLDHCVITVSDWEISNRFYQQVLGAELVAVGVGWAYRFGQEQMNVHGPGVPGDPNARLPIPAGGSDLCFEWGGPIEEAIAHLAAQRVSIEVGPVARLGAKGSGVSVYFRDADGSLMKFISYQRQRVAPKWPPLQPPQAISAGRSSPPVGDVHPDGIGGRYAGT